MNEAVEQPTADPGAANPVRGEIEVSLGDPARDYVLRPSYEAIVAIEKGTGKGLLHLFREAAEATMPLGDLAVVIAECIRAQGRAAKDRMMASVDADRIGALIMESPYGHSGVLARAAVLLGGAVCGDYNASGEVKAAQAPAEPTPNA